MRIWMSFGYGRRVKKKKKKGRLHSYIVEILADGIRKCGDGIIENDEVLFLFVVC